LTEDFSRFVRAKSGVSTLEIAVKGARCANCIAKIEAGVKSIDGVAGARLNLSTGKLVAEWRGTRVSPAAVIQRVQDLGYEAQPYDAGETLSTGEKEGRLLLHCLVVAALAPCSSWG